MNQNMYLRSLTIYLLVLAIAALEPLNFTAKFNPPPRDWIRLKVSGTLGTFTVKIGAVIAGKGDPKDVDFEIDTSCPVTWVPCPKGGYKIYCTDKQCAAVGGVNGDCPPVANAPCIYHFTYDDGTTHPLELNLGWVYLPLYGHTWPTPAAIACGCSPGIGEPFHNAPTSTRGILGLGRGAGGFVNQLSSVGLIQEVFGHCLRSDGVGSFLFLGYYNDRRFTTLAWQPLTGSEQYYALGRANILVNGKPAVAVPQIVVDTGSNYTHINSRAYSIVSNQISSIVSSHSQLDRDHNPRDNTDLPVCWKYDPPIHPFGSIDQIAHFFPTITFKFARKVRFVISPQQYLVMSGLGIACLGILDGRQQNVIGAISMQGKFVAYDNVLKKVGWMDVDSC